MRQLLQEPAERWTMVIPIQVEMVEMVEWEMLGPFARERQKVFLQNGGGVR
jgi:hypothetical protein